MIWASISIIEYSIMCRALRSTNFWAANIRKGFLYMLHNSFSSFPTWATLCYTHLHLVMLLSPFTHTSPCFSASPVPHNLSPTMVPTLTIGTQCLLLRHGTPFSYVRLTLLVYYAIMQPLHLPMRMLAFLFDERGNCYRLQALTWLGIVYSLASGAL